MMMPKIVDRSRPALLYLTLIGLLLLAVFIQARMNLTLSVTGGFIPYQQPIAAFTFGLSIACGLLGAYRHAARCAQPWKVPQSQVFLCFIGFFIFGAAALMLSF